MSSVQPNTLILLLSLLATCGGFIAQWLREKRNREWQMTDAKEMAEKVSSDAIALALNEIANLGAQLLIVTNHIASEEAARKEFEVERLTHEKIARDDAIFNERVKEAIDEKILEMNGHAPAVLRRKRKTT